MAISTVLLPCVHLLKTHISKPVDVFRNCILIIAQTVLLHWNAFPQSVEDDLARAYSFLSTNPQEATIIFESIVKRSPTNVVARRQLGWLYIIQKDFEKALNQFEEANSLLPSDTTKLQVAFLLDLLGRNYEAYEHFVSLDQSQDSLIRARAILSAAVLKLILCSASHPWWFKLYAAPYFDSRFENGILLLSGHAGYHLNERRDVSLFGNLGITKDTRSTGGSLPQIFSDNYALLATGFRFQPLNGFTTDVQIGIAYNLTNQAIEDRTRVDFRAVSTYGGGWFPEIALPGKLVFPMNPFADFYASFGYYSRYTNAIGYAHIRAGIRAAAWGYSSADIYLRSDINVDTERIYYNNIAEGSVGLRLVPDFQWGVSLLAEYHWGKYWGTQSPLPVDMYYRSFRLFLVLDSFLCL